MAAAPEFTGNLLRVSARAYAQATVAMLEAARPNLLQSALPPTFAQPRDDIEVRIQQIGASVFVDRPALLRDALQWYKVAFHHRGVPSGYLADTLRAIEKTLEREMPRDSFALVRRHIHEATQSLPAAPSELPSLLRREAPYGEQAMHFLLANLEGRGEDALDRIRSLLAGGASVEDVQDHVLVPSQREAGRMWLMAEIPVADEHYGSSVVERALWLLQERVPRPPADAPRVMTMGVGGNLHDLGLRVVAQRLQVAGFQVHHLGANMPANDLDWALRSRDVQAIAMSASMLLHLPGLRDAIVAVRSAIERLHGDPAAVPILVGGHPFDVVDDLHEVLGADAGVADASEAPAAIRALLERIERSPERS